MKFKIFFASHLVIHALLSVGLSSGLSESEMGLIAEDIRSHLGGGWRVSVDHPKLAIDIADENVPNQALVRLIFLSWDKERYLNAVEEKLSLWVKLYRGFEYKRDYSEVKKRFDAIDLPEYQHFGFYVDAAVLGDGRLVDLEKKEKLLFRLSSFFLVLPKFQLP